MGISDRDYMKKSSDDRKRVEAYEKAVHEEEYGSQPALSKIALVIITIIVLLALLAAIL